ncbi:MAG TPA: hypothetical protein VGT24_07690 [Candidatus Acidoferrales bacterium]|nr:hypothetical protein [Candidatus Acidoferrales bacterium]
MRQCLFVCAALICFSMPAAAQDSAATFDASSALSEPAVPVSFTPPDRAPWQLGVGFQYLHYSILGTPFHNFGFKADITRYMTNWFGVEGATVAGFGHAGSSPSLDAKSFFIGGGPHVSVYNSPRLEPWVHVLVGWERFRFTQTATLGANSGVAVYAGGGVDYKFGGGRLYWRVQGDYIGARIASTMTTNYAFGTGLILNF